MPMTLTEKILDTWQITSAIPGTFWPTNDMSRWIFEKVTSRTSSNFFALGLINPANNSGPAATSRLAVLELELPRQDVWFSGWELLGNAIFSSVKKNLWKLLVPMVCLILLSLRPMPASSSM